MFPLGLNSNRVVNITITEYYYGIYTGHEEGMICLTFAMCTWIVTVYVCTIIGASLSEPHINGYELHE